MGEEVITTGAFVGRTVGEMLGFVLGEKVLVVKLGFAHIEKFFKLTFAAGKDVDPA